MRVEIYVALIWAKCCEIHLRPMVGNENAMNKSVQAHLTREIEITIATSFPDKITRFWLADSSAKKEWIQRKNCNSVQVTIIVANVLNNRVWVRTNQIFRLGGVKRVDAFWWHTCVTSEPEVAV